MSPTDGRPDQCHHHAKTLKLQYKNAESKIYIYTDMYQGHS